MIRLPRLLFLSLAVVAAPLSAQEYKVAKSDAAPPADALTPEIAGLLPHEAIGFLRALRGLRFSGYDVGEVAPAYDTQAQTTALVAANVKSGRLHFTTDLSSPVAEADAVFIAVGTPSRRGDGHADGEPARRRGDAGRLRRAARLPRSEDRSTPRGRARRAPATAE